MCNILFVHYILIKLVLKKMSSGSPEEEKASIWKLHFGGCIIFLEPKLLYSAPEILVENSRHTAPHSWFGVSIAESTRLMSSVRRKNAFQKGNMKTDTLQATANILLGQNDIKVFLGQDWTSSTLGI